MEWYRGQLICLDEILRLPEFLSFLRSEIHRDRSPGRFLLLGSATPTLLSRPLWPDAVHGAPGSAQAD